jgi:small subunit ribosomal protein S1
MGRGKRVNHPREVLSVGQDLTVKVLSVDPVAKRLALSFGDFEAESEEKEEKEDLTHYQKQAPASMGTLGDLLKKGMDRKKEK